MKSLLKISVIINCCKYHIVKNNSYTKPCSVDYGYKTMFSANQNSFSNFARYNKKLQLGLVKLFQLFELLPIIEHLQLL